MPRCSSCAGELPEKAVFCPTCGEKTPTGIHRESGTAELTLSSATDQETAERRRELQAAVGDDCEVRELLGRGGFADVYVGWDRRLKRELAIKTLRSDLLTSTNILERFQREAEAVAKLRHPHIIPIYGVGEGSGRAYFTMPRIEGESLGAILQREGRLEVSEAVRILRESAGALDAAHRAGLVHRDVKPENIMLEGSERRALVMDFGIAKSIESGEQGLTGTGMLVGTPHFMSPEQAAGDRNTDHRTDQYSLAVVGYRMLTGCLPFEGDSLQVVLVKQVTEDPEPLVQVAPHVPQEVAAVIHRALQKRPEDRFPSMKEFVTALDAATVHVGAETTRKAAPPLAVRVATMRALLPGIRHPLLIAGLLGLVIYAVVAPRTVPQVAYSLAGEVDAATFAARAELARHGVTGRLHQAVELKQPTEVYTFLRDEVGADSVEALARAGIPVWHWHVRARSPEGGPAWHVDVAPGGRITRVQQLLQDTASFAAAEPQVAESLALAELGRRGWNERDLIRRPDSTITRRSRTDRIFNWQRPDATFARNGRDTAFAAVRVQVSGGEVTDFAEVITMPPKSGGSDDPLDVVSIIGWILLVALAAYAIPLAISRQRSDTLQWGTAVRVTLVVLVLFTISALAEVLPSARVAAESTSGLLALIAVVIVLGVLLSLLLIFAFAAAESLAAEHRPQVMGGVAEMTRGKLLVPELATAAAAGLAIAGIVLCIEALAAFGALKLSGGPPTHMLPEALGLPTPISALALHAALAILVAVIILFAQHVVWHLKPVPALAIGVPAILLTMLPAGADAVTPVMLVSTLASALLVSWGIWRFGLLSGVVAGFILVSAPGLLGLAMVHGVTLATIGAFAAVLLPLVAGRLAYRKYRTQAG